MLASFFDEPLAGLDQQGIADVVALLESLVEERKITLVIIEHITNQSYLHPLVTTHWLLEKGKLQRNGKILGLTVALESTAIASKRYPACLSLLAGDDAEILDESLPRGAILTRIRRPDRLRIRPNPFLRFVISL